MLVLINFFGHYLCITALATLHYNPTSQIAGYNADFPSLAQMREARARPNKEENHRLHRFHRCGQWAIVLAPIAVSMMGAARGSEPLRAEPQSLERVTSKLIERLRAEPYAYFRFVNHSWIARVCDDFGRDLEQLLVVRLQGDAHVEQFAVTKEAWGLDDFDDSARGPAVIDITRF